MSIYTMQILLFFLFTSRVYCFTRNAVGLVQKPSPTNLKAATEDIHIHSKIISSERNANSEMKMQMDSLKIIHTAEKLRGLIKIRDSMKDVSNQTGLSLQEMKRIIILAKRKEKELVMTNLGLVYSIARSFNGRGMEFEDLVYEGIRGLRKAISKFNIEKGTVFSTYAYPWVKDYMRAALAAAPPITLPRHVYKLAVKVNAIRNRFFRRLGYNPTDEELALELGITMDRFDIVRRAMALVNRTPDTLNKREISLNKPTPTPYHATTWEKKDTLEYEGRSFTENLVSMEPQPQVAAGYNDVQQTMISILSTLPQQEAAAVLHRLGLGNPTSSTIIGNEEEKANYRRGLRKLRKIMSDPVFSDLSVSSMSIISDDTI